MTEQGTGLNRGTYPLSFCADAAVPEGACTDTAQAPESTSTESEGRPDNWLRSCMICPRGCGADRTAGERGYCGQADEPAVSLVRLHMWEEPCISGVNGSGTVFFNGCNLHCVFCQNYQISGRETGQTITVGRLAEIFLELQSEHAHNINLVTPTHFAPQIIKALDIARGQGLVIPVVYNCGGYESVETVRSLEGYVDVWMPDFKYKSAELSARYSHAPDYFERASATLAEMVRQTQGQFEFDEHGMMRRGVLVRHLILPGQTADSKRVLRYLHETYGDSIYISIMSQFTPVGDLTAYEELNRRLSADEYARVVAFAESIGIRQGFIQEGDTAKESFIPQFDGKGVVK